MPVARDLETTICVKRLRDKIRGMHKGSILNALEQYQCTY